MEKITWIVTVNRKAVSIHKTEEAARTAARGHITKTWRDDSRQATVVSVYVAVEYGTQDRKLTLGEMLARICHHVLSAQLILPSKIANLKPFEAFGCCWVPQEMHSAWVHRTGTCRDERPKLECTKARLDFNPY